jgi:hypothetical protein
MEYLESNYEKWRDEGVLVLKNFFSSDELVKIQDDFRNLYGESPTSLSHYPGNHPGSEIKKWDSPHISFENHPEFLQAHQTKKNFLKPILPHLSIFHNLIQDIPCFSFINSVILFQH